MKIALLSVLLFGVLSSKAFEATNHVLRLDTSGNVIATSRQIPNTFQGHVNYHKAGSDVWLSDRWRPYSVFELEEGYYKIAGTRSFTQLDGRWIEVWETETTEEVELREQQLFESLAQETSPFIVMLSGVLFEFGLSIPVQGGYLGALHAVGNMELTPNQIVMIGTLQAVYEGCKSAVSHKAQELGYRYDDIDDVITRIYETIMTEGDE